MMGSKIRYELSQNPGMLSCRSHIQTISNPVQSLTRIEVHSPLDPRIKDKGHGIELWRRWHTMKLKLTSTMQLVSGNHKSAKLKFPAIAVNKIIILSA